MALIASARERPFDLEELFAWTADGTGRIRTADAVFVRLSGYEPDALDGQTLEFLRHPEMPRTLLRELFRPGQPSAAYVKHVAKDGAFFWAMVLTIPAADGFLAVGFKPAAPVFDEARALYREVRAAELAGGEPGAGHGAFLRAAFTAEVAARPARPADAGGDAARAAAALLERFSERLAGHGALSESLRRKSGFVEELAESIRLFSLNAILAAYRLADAAAIGAVASLMQTRSDAAQPEILALGTEIEQVATLLSETSFRAAAGRIQTELLIASEDTTLVEPIAETLEAVSASMLSLDGALDRLSGTSHAVEEHLKMIRFLELQGRIEAARASDTEHVRVLFEEIGRQVRAAGTELTDFSALGTRRNRVDASDAREARRIAAALRAG